jgi:hypothetical protein
MSVVVDQSQLSELVHEVSNARSRRAHHFGERRVTQRPPFGIGRDFVVAQASELQENSSESPLTMVEKLIAKIFFEIDITGWQNRDELRREIRMVMKRSKHRFPFNLKHRCCFDNRGGAHSHRWSKREPSPKKWRGPIMASTASLPAAETGDSVGRAWTSKQEEIDQTDPWRNEDREEFRVPDSRLRASYGRKIPLCPSFMQILGTDHISDTEEANRPGCEQENQP